MRGFKLEAATRFPSIIASGSLIPIVVYRDGDGYSWLNTYYIDSAWMAGSGGVVERLFTATRLGSRWK